MGNAKQQQAALVLKYLLPFNCSLCFLGITAKYVDTCHIHILHHTVETFHLHFSLPDNVFVMLENFTTGKKSLQRDDLCLSSDPCY